MAEIDLLIVAATPLETAWLRKQWQLPAESWQAAATPQGRVGLLHTGIGAVNAAWALGQTLARQRPRQAIQVGIAGSYDPAIPVGAVVEVQEEIFGDLGADAPAGFQDLEAMGFGLGETGGQLVYNHLQNPQPAFSDLPQVRGVTLNTVSGTTAGIAEQVRRWQPQVESMEGAAFFLAMLRSGVPFSELRGISNRVEPRNRARWQPVEAAQQVQQALWDRIR